MSGPNRSALAKRARVSLDVYSDWRGYRRVGGKSSLKEWLADPRFKAPRAKAEKMDHREDAMRYYGMTAGEANRHAAGNSGQTGDDAQAASPIHRGRVKAASNSNYDTEPGGAVAPGATTDGLTASELNAMSEAAEDACKRIAGQRENVSYTEGKATDFGARYKTLLEGKWIEDCQGIERLGDVLRNYAKLCPAPTARSSATCWAEASHAS